MFVRPLESDFVDRQNFREAIRSLSAREDARHYIGMINVIAGETLKEVAPEIENIMANAT